MQEYHQVNQDLQSEEGQPTQVPDIKRYSVETYRVFYWNKIDLFANSLFVYISITKIKIKNVYAFDV